MQAEPQLLAHQFVLFFDRVNLDRPQLLLIHLLSGGEVIFRVVVIRMLANNFIVFPDMTHDNCILQYEIRDLPTEPLIYHFSRLTPVVIDCSVLAVSDGNHRERILWINP